MFSEHHPNLTGVYALAEFCLPIAAGAMCFRRMREKTPKLVAEARQAERYAKGRPLVTIAPLAGAVETVAG